jgi:selenocysteine lyase/cysteine desulfurase
MISNQKRKFSLPSGSIYLNGAYMSPLLKDVEKVGVAGIKRKRDPSRISSEDFFTDAIKLRKEFAKLINTREHERVAIIPSASYGLANAARNMVINRQDNIIVAGEQFPSNVFSWMRLCEENGSQLKIVKPPESLTEHGKVWNEKILEAIDKKTRLVAVGHVHWAYGTKFDLLEIRKRTREVGALLVIDGTQSVGALPFDVSKIQPDALVCAGYKWLLGPYSIGVAYYGDYFDHGTPIEENWINRQLSEDFTRLVNYQTGYQPGALRYDVGERSNFTLTPMLTAAMQQINHWKPENIQAYCAKISRDSIDQLRGAGFWVEEEPFRANHLFGVRLPKGTDLEKIKRGLNRYKISVSFRGDAIRVSPNVYNSEADLKKLVKALTAFE